MSTSTVLTVVMGDYPRFRRLREPGRRFGGATLRFDDSFCPTNRAFRPMVERQPFDLCEMALGTYIQAKSVGVPISFVPITLFGRFQHDQLLVRRSDVGRHPAWLEGRRIGVRSYSQTTGIWVRAFLRRQYGVAVEGLRWVVLESAHVRAIASPKHVEMAPEGSSLERMLQAGELDAIIGGGEGEDKAPILERPEVAARAWHAQTGVVPVNHVFTVADRLRGTAENAVTDLFGALRASADRDGGGSIDGEHGPRYSLPVGIDEFRPVLEILADELPRQGLVASPIDVAAILDTWVAPLCVN